MYQENSEAARGVEIIKGRAIPTKEGGICRISLNRSGTDGLETQGRHGT